MSDLNHIVMQDSNQVLRDLLDVTKVAVGPNMPQVESEPLTTVIGALLNLIEKIMPAEVQAQDKRVLAARALVTKHGLVLHPH